MAQALSHRFVYQITSQQPFCCFITCPSPRKQGDCSDPLFKLNDASWLCASFHDPCRKVAPQALEFSSSCEPPAHHHSRRPEAMGKRTNFEGDASGAHASKRQRVEAGHERNSPRPNGAGAEEVHSGRDLQKALYFDQNATADFRNGMRNRSDVSSV
jgi:hypothetical protein